MQKPWTNWSLNEWLHNLEHRHAQEIQLGLSRVLEVAKKLELNVSACPVITVAGTNGKGSTVTALEAIYHTAGYKVGTYTSPHLLIFNERIRVGSQHISDKDLCSAFCIIEEARARINLTYFEMTTLAALWHFKQGQLDIIILEVGLGGRLDATNVIDADLSIITGIDYDHQDYLGNTLDAIGTEKAGILRAERPFIYADDDPPKSIVAIAANLNTRSYYYGKDFIIREKKETWGIDHPQGSIANLPKPKIQIKAAAAAILASIILRAKLAVNAQNLSLAMDAIFIPGRLQLLKGPLSFLYDVSHNAQSVRLLAKKIAEYDKKGAVHAVFSALKDKDLFNLIFPLKDCVDHWYPAQLDNKRATHVDILKSVFREAEICIEFCYTSPLTAFEAALSKAKTGDLVVVYGSFFTVGQIMTTQHNYLELKEI